MFDTRATLDRVIPAAERDEFLRYGLRALPVQFGDVGESELPLAAVHPEPIPAHWRRLGYDVCSRGYDSLFDASPLSCNDCAASAAANRWCLLDTLPLAVAVAQRFGREEPEPGPYVVLEVHAERLPFEPARGSMLP